MSQTPNTRNRRDRHRYWQELVPRCRPRCARRDRAAAEVVAWPSRNSLRQYAALPDRHGSLRRRASSEPQTRSLGHDARLMPAKYVRPIDVICAVVDFKNAVQAVHGYRNGPSTRSSIVSSQAPLKGLNSDDAEIVARIIALSYAEGRQRGVDIAKEWSESIGSSVSARGAMFFRQSLLCL